MHITLPAACVTLSEKEQITINFANGQRIIVGFGGAQQVPTGKAWVITESNDNERGFVLKPSGKLTEYPLL